MGCLIRPENTPKFTMQRLWKHVFVYYFSGNQVKIVVVIVVETQTVNHEGLFNQE